MPDEESSESESGRDTQMAIVQKKTAEVYDLEQDSEVEIQEISVKSKRDSKRHADADEYDKVQDFFEPPFWKEGDTQGIKINYRCKWCQTVYRAHGSSFGNLKTHRDGSNQAEKNASGCQSCAKAIKAGARLPPSVAEQRAAATINSSQQQITNWAQRRPKFKNLILNHLLVLWQIRQVLPWTWIEDDYLRVAFAYANANANLFGRKWSAQQGKTLYASLKQSVFNDLKNLSSRFTLIHNVWTTKGNRFAFIGASVTYINSDWKYITQHLALKMIPWKHEGVLLARPIAHLLKKDGLYHKMLAQTTDSGSNNNTMAREMVLMFDEDTDGGPNQWMPSTMHIRCVCHKLALVVNAGLKALSINNASVSTAKKSVLGFFPTLKETIEEEEEPDGSPDKTNGDEVQIQIDDKESEYSNVDASDSEDESNADDSDSDPPSSLSNSPSSLQMGTRLRDLTEKLDKVVKIITRSAAQRGNYRRVVQKLKLKNIPMLIAGYGIRWNIKYESRRRAILAKEVLNFILREDQEQAQSNGRKSHQSHRPSKKKSTITVFQDISFSPRDWNDLQTLNDELEVYVKLTGAMAGDGPTGALVLPKYLDLRDSLAVKINKSEKSNDLLYPMFSAMRKRVECYLEEAMQCETLILATLLHPCFRLEIFDLGFGSKSVEIERCKAILQKEFDEYKNKHPVPTPSQSKSQKKNKEQHRGDDDNQESEGEPEGLLAKLHSRILLDPAAKNDTELEDYLKANLSFRKADLKNVHYVLEWWKVHSSTYPTLAMMARDYLATSASSCTVERLFSAAADVCTSNRGCLSPTSMVQCVSSRMWLCEGVPLSGPFEEAGQVLKTILPLINDKTQK